jgi:hypothetical protein
MNNGSSKFLKHHLGLIHLKLKRLLSFKLYLLNISLIIELKFTSLSLQLIYFIRLRLS